MPNVSQAQRGAMAAAKAGKSTLGIPKSVGEDFMASDPGGKLPARAASKPRSAKQMFGKKAAPSRPPRL